MNLISASLPSCHFTSSVSECELILGDVNYYGFVDINLIILYFLAAFFSATRKSKNVVGFCFKYW